MDAAEEDADIRLQKISDDLLREFDDALGPFLRWPGSKATEGDGQQQQRRLRARVRAREADRLAGLIDSFQELPQLLDNHLSRWLPMLAEAFLGCVAQAARTPGEGAGLSTSLAVPLQAAVARLLYTFCKVRGEKVVVGFLPVETRHLEQLLGALETQERRRQEQELQQAQTNTVQDDANTADAGGWTWEERYVVLLWLAQLLLAPFDLATISTGRTGDDEADEEGGLAVAEAMEGFAWPGGGRVTLPSITVRVLPLAMQYLAAAGKERDAARALLVRVAMRRDMQQLGVRHALVQWALGSLRQGGVATTTKPAYYYIGTLSFLAGILGAAAGASDMDDALASIFAAVDAVAEAEAETDNAVFATIRSSALARKMMIKAVRAIAVRYIQLGEAQTDPADLMDEVGETTIETTIGYLLARLGDNDTPVRIAASKALSVIALRLRPEMADQVIDAVLAGLDSNVLTLADGRRDLSAVDPLEWHGLVLTLAQLLYRRSPPLSALPAIVAALRIGLAFERRSVSGNATGTNVRDAACFGIWALARRYTTDELRPLAVLQPLATDLVVAASLDPAGNIRRGSSAALQELVGRHPDVVRAGIGLVLAVDYHAVALRSRAVAAVAGAAAALAPGVYGVALRDALLGWRGTTDAADATARRAAAASFGQISLHLATADRRDGDVHPLHTLPTTATLLGSCLARLQPRQADERHGLLLALAAVLDTVPALAAAQSASPVDRVAVLAPVLSLLCRVLQSVQTLTRAAALRRPELLAEATSRLIVSAFPILQAAAADGGETTLLPGPELVAEANRVSAAAFGSIVTRMTAAQTDDSRTWTDLASVLLADLCLVRAEPEAVGAASDAALVLLVLLPTAAARTARIQDWATAVRQPVTGVGSTMAKTRAAARSGAGSGYMFALAKAYPLVAHMDDDDPISRAILDRWAADRSIETRVALLQALAQSPAVLTTTGARFRLLLAAGLDDYTTDSRGDVGSQVRLQALHATRALWAAEGDGPASSGAVLFLRVLRLAAEKLDRVRVAAQATLALALGAPLQSQLLALTFSAQAYFRQLLGLWDAVAAGRLGPVAVAAVGQAGPRQAAAVRWTAALMRGYVSSADTGNEELVIASRAALVDYVGGDVARRQLLWQALVRNLPGGLPATSTATKVRTVPPPDRVVVPTLEVVAFLFYSGIFSDTDDADLAALCQQVAQAAERAPTMRKLEACIKVYGAVATAAVTTTTTTTGGGTSRAGADARQRLATLLHYPWPRIRNAVIDELWGLGLGLGREREQEQGTAAAGMSFASLKGVDWGAADDEALDALASRLQLAG